MPVRRILLARSRKQESGYGNRQCYSFQVYSPVKMSHRGLAYSGFKTLDDGFRYSAAILVTF